jgi:hypothetical protein
MYRPPPLTVSWYWQPTDPTTMSPRQAEMISGVRFLDSETVEMLHGWRRELRYSRMRR